MRGRGGPLVSRLPALQTSEGETHSPSAARRPIIGIAVISLRFGSDRFFSPSPVHCSAALESIQTTAPSPSYAPEEAALLSFLLCCLTAYSLVAVDFLSEGQQFDLHPSPVMPWADDDEDEDALLDLAAVEDRRGGEEEEEDEDEEEENADEDERITREDDNANSRHRDDQPPPHPKHRPAPPHSRVNAATLPLTVAGSAAVSTSTTSVGGELGGAQSPAQIALLYLTHKIAEEVGRERKVRFSKEVLSCVRDVVAGYAQTMGRDTEHFAKHAKRTTTALETFKRKERIGTKKKKATSSTSTRKRKAAVASDGEGAEGEDKEDEEGEDDPRPNRSTARRPKR